MFNRTSFQHCLVDIKAGVPICLKYLDKSFLICSVEMVDSESIEYLRASGDVSLFISKYRMSFLCDAHEYGYSSCPKNVSADQLRSIASGFANSVPGMDFKISTDSHFCEYIFNMMREASLLSAFLIVEASPVQHITIMDFEDIVLYFKESPKVHFAGSSTLKLRNVTSHVLIRSYRVLNRSICECFALIIGDYDKNTTPMIRIHSSCYTGDLMDSLLCDCGDQLRGSIRYIDDAIGNGLLKYGVILYLMQEGRSIGLINKIRTYYLQRNLNLDTMSANNFIGFDDDERDFRVASSILYDLQIKECMLITENVDKVTSLACDGITVKEVVSIGDFRNEYNSYYLDTKMNRNIGLVGVCDGEKS